MTTVRVRVKRKIIVYTEIVTAAGKDAEKGGDTSNTAAIMDVDSSEAKEAKPKPATASSKIRKPRHRRERNRITFAATGRAGAKKRSKR
jgi:hypothetical protein